MLKIFQARLQQYLNQELLDVQAGFSKGREQGSHCQLNHRESKGIPEKNFYFWFIDYAKAFDYVNRSKLENS